MSSRPTTGERLSGWTIRSRLTDASFYRSKNMPYSDPDAPLNIRQGACGADLTRGPRSGLKPSSAPTWILTAAIAQLAPKAGSQQSTQ